MSDWQVGDLAVCLKDGRYSRKGGIYTVAEVVPRGLWFVELSRDGVAPGTLSRFRKIRPDEQQGNAEDWQLLRETHKRKVSA